jgi:Asp-tRNA(Asn)/Glu-tRNA(Gln) amidotransferase A subunit family amidase
VISSEELVEACLARIREVDPEVQAWAFLDPVHSLGQARAADAWRLEGRPVGPLHGVPVGVKDIIDTADMPTESGSVLHAGRQPGRDATVVAMLRAAGAVIMGKTVTTEFATYAPGKTRNPHNPAHTPGGSSSGSAAAVAAGMVPLALGSQTNGSVIRPPRSAECTASSRPMA